MGCLYSVFDVKKQGKPVWVVRARNWKLRGGENRLSGLLLGVSVSGNVFTWLSSDLMMVGGLDWACQLSERSTWVRGMRMRRRGSSWLLFNELGRQGSKGDRVKPLFKYGFCEYGSVNKQWGGYALFEERNDLGRFLVKFRHVAAQISEILVLSIGTLSGVSIPKSNTGIWVSVPAWEGIGTPGIDTC
ncbi:hypothetical protein GQ457_05G013700 [Hibiscus cannabinus]